MRFASRMVGVMLTLSGLGCLGLAVFLAVSGFAPESVLAESRRSATAWFGAALLLAVALGFLLGGWYFFRLDTDAPGEPRATPFASFLIAHRGKFKWTAQIGLAVSLLWVAAAGLGLDQARGWANGILIPVGIALAIIETQIIEPQTSGGLDWEAMPTPIRPLLKATWRVGGAAFLILFLLLIRNQWRHRPSPAVLIAGFLPLLFGWEVLFFCYGKLRTDRRTG